MANGKQNKPVFRLVAFETGTQQHVNASYAVLQRGYSFTSVNTIVKPRCLFGHVSWIMVLLTNDKPAKGVTGKLSGAGYEAESTKCIRRT